MLNINKVEIIAPAKNAVHVMVDLETLGRRAGCKIVSIGAVVFEPEGVTNKTFYQVLNTDAQGELHEDEDTVTWWARQSDEARKVFTDPDKVSFAAGMANFTQWVATLGGKNSARLWGNGSDFDNAIIISALEEAAVQPTWQFWNHRCYRTLKNLHKTVELGTRQGTYHNALDDAITQAEHAVRIMNAFNLWASV